jgi:hypothetical protein
MPEPFIMSPQSIAHHRIVFKLGETGMGAVYRATDGGIADGQRFLILTPLESTPSDPMIVVQNWTEGFKP